jgi:hemerythrin
MCKDLKLKAQSSKKKNDLIQLPSAFSSYLREHFEATHNAAIGQKMGI